jgi:hypothetical protein
MKDIVFTPTSRGCHLATSRAPFRFVREERNTVRRKRQARQGERGVAFQCEASEGSRLASAHAQVAALTYRMHCPRCWNP